MNQKTIIFFDGVCNLCNGTVQFLINRDTNDRLRFAPLQSPLGQRVAAQSSESNGQSIVVIHNKRLYTKSSAALRIAKQLSFPWKLFYVFILIPKQLRNSIYQLISKNRYDWFGKQESCMVPTPQNQRKFISQN